MGRQILYALIIFVSFASIGGLIVRYIIVNQEPSDDDLPPRGVPWDSTDD